MQTPFDENDLYPAPDRCWEAESEKMQPLEKFGPHVNFATDQI